MEALKVAIADDNENMLKVLGQVIGQEQDLSVVGTATNGEDTFHIIKEKEPDVVLLDIIMPQIDGLTVMEKVHKDKEIRKTPAFIIISAIGRDSVTEDAFNMGASYYIMKPFDNDMLINRIRYIRNVHAEIRKQEQHRRWNIRWSVTGIWKVILQTSYMTLVFLRILKGISI